jgi:hypothetical protein
MQSWPSCASRRYAVKGSVEEWEEALATKGTKGRVQIRSKRTQEGEKMKPSVGGYWL